jgi:hypothetical protein
MDSMSHAGGAETMDEPSGTPVFSVDHITYTWWNINVHTSDLKLRRRGIWNRRRREFTTEQKGKHILKSGDLIIFTFTVYLFSSNVTPFKKMSSKKLCAQVHKALNFKRR